MTTTVKVNIPFSTWTSKAALEVEVPDDTDPPFRLRAAVEIAVREGANLSGVNLSGVNLSGVNLSGVNLSGVNLSGVILSGANLHGANLHGADLRRVILSGANLHGADLRRVILSGANLHGVNLSGVNLSGANLSGADLADAGQDRRGYRFWAWRRADGTVIYRAGCREWGSIDAARAHFGPGYRSDGDHEECLARLALLHAEATNRGWFTPKATEQEDR